MNKLIKTFCLSVALMLLVTYTIAQSGEWMNKPADERAKILTEWMVENLAITEEQQSEVYEINLKYADKGTELKESSVNKREKFKAIKEYDSTKDKELKGIFTDQQYALYQDKKRELKQKIREHHKNGED